MLCVRRWDSGIFWQGLQKALGFSKTSGGSALKIFLDLDKISPYITDDIKFKLENRKQFSRLGAGGAISRTYGYDVTLLIDISLMLMEARDHEELTKKLLWQK